MLKMRYLDLAHFQQFIPLFLGIFSYNPYFSRPIKL
jgi:hypothetical protein